MNICVFLCSTYALVNSLESPGTLVSILVECECGAIFLKLYRYVKFSSNYDNFNDVKKKLAWNFFYNCLEDRDNAWNFKVTSVDIL